MWVYICLNFEYEIGYFVFGGGYLLFVVIMGQWWWCLFYQVVEYMVDVEVVQGGVKEYW